MENLFKVKLRSQLTNMTVTFDVVPDIGEQRQVEYKGYNPIHSPGTIYTYSHTQSRIISVNNARLISRNGYEAAANLAKLNILRSWTMPYFGNSTDEYVGLPPDVLSFYAFSRGPQVRSVDAQGSNENTDTIGQQTLQSAASIRRNDTPTHLQNVPTVVSNLQITYPSDVDYIPTVERRFKFANDIDDIVIKAGEPVPSIISVDIQLYETQSPSDYNRFSLQDYRAGRLDRF